MAKRPTMLEELPAAIRRRGPLRWYEQAPADVMAELEEIRQKFRRREIAATKNGLAAALSKLLATRNVTIGQLAIVKWLDAE